MLCIQIDIFHSNVTLQELYTLWDIANIYTWRRVFVYVFCLYLIVLFVCLLSVSTLYTPFSLVMPVLLMHFFVNLVKTKSIMLWNSYAHMPHFLQLLQVRPFHRSRLWGNCCGRTS